MRWNQHGLIILRDVLRACHRQSFLFNVAYTAPLTQDGKGRLQGGNQQH